ncbi:MAG: hypothetical protein H0W78_07925 [Planctomycetes bacterium]|nr:hypothetical protein [Planctomycetota bacterium]
MPGPEDHPAAERLGRALGGLRQAQETWLEDCFQVCEDDPAFTATFRRWEEQLTIIKLHLHRAETRLLHFVNAAPLGEPATDLPPRGPLRRSELAHLWRTRFEAYFTTHHLDSVYRRLDSVLDHDQEAMSADIITDLTQLAETAQLTSNAIAALDLAADPSGLEEIAFYRVISPWRTHGQAALMDVLRWLAETLREQEEW